MTHAVWGRFRRPDVNDVVLGKTDQLQLLVLAPAGDGTELMRLAHQQPLHGTPWTFGSSRAPPRTAGVPRARDLLGILSDSGKLSIVGFDRRTRRPAPIRQLHPAPPGLPIAPHVDDARHRDGSVLSSLAVDPARCVAVRCDTHVSVFFTSYAATWTTARRPRRPSPSTPRTRAGVTTADCNKPG